MIAERMQKKEYPIAQSVICFHYRALIGASFSNYVHSELLS